MFISKKVQISSEFNKYSIKFRTVTVYVQLVQLRLSKMKLAISIAVLLLAISSFAFAQSDLERAKQEFTTLRDELTVNRFSDSLFLLDTSDSLDSFGFDSEKKFIINFLNTMPVGMQAARVEVIPFGDIASLYIDGVSNPSLSMNKCDIFQKLKQMPLSINGFSTNTKSAFQLAFDVCLGPYSSQKRVLWNKLKTVVILITDGRWNQGPSPVPIAKMLHAANIEVFAIGVGNVITPDTLQEVVRDPAKQAFHLKDFAEFDELSLYVRGGK